MRSLVQIPYPAALATVTHNVTNRRTSICPKRRLFCHQTLHPSSQIIHRQSATVVATATPRFNLSKKSDRNAIGITHFLEGKNYLVSGATGFLAKAFVEKLLRTVPDVGKIFVLIRAENKEEAKRRLYSDIIESDVFETIKQTYGGSYKSFMEMKLVPVIGNIGEDNLGMDDETIDEIASEIDIVVNSAASTTLDERYDVALNINTQGPARLLSFATKCKKLSLFLQFSTAYANGKRGGNIVEKPLYMGQSIDAERTFSGYSPVSIPMLDVESEIKLAKRTSQRYGHDEITPKLKELGQERANLHGWKNCYTLTKAMGEMLLNSSRGYLPVVIIRPSVIESAYKEPYPGWIQGNKVLDPVISLYGKGQLPGFVFDPQVLIDVIPVDMVVNTAIAAMAKHGQIGGPELTVYHTTSSSANPLSLEQMFDNCYEYFTHYPLKDSRGHEIKIQRMEAISSVEDFSAYITSRIIADHQDVISNGFSRCMFDVKQIRKVKRIINVAKLYQPYFFYYGRFDNTNCKNLIEEMSHEEKEMFDFDIWGLDWKDYFVNVHIPGIKKHVMKGRC